MTDDNTLAPLLLLTDPTHASGWSFLQLPAACGASHAWHCYVSVWAACHDWLALRCGVKHLHLGHPVPIADAR
jgi:hypothetical protein